MNQNNMPFGPDVELCLNMCFCETDRNGTAEKKERRKGGPQSFNHVFYFNHSFCFATTSFS
jgi:hypothetical protein